MGFVLSLTSEESEALREQAAKEHRSMHEVARLAVMDRVHRAARNEILDAIVDEIVQEDAQLLKALADA
jgi:hypothetical protein